MIIESVRKNLDITGTEVSSYTVTYVGTNVVAGVPLDPANTDYAEIMKQVEAGTLTIQEAE